MLISDRAADFRSRAERVGTAVHAVVDLAEAARLILSLAGPEARIAVAPSAADEQLLTTLGDRAHLGGDDPRQAADAAVGVVRGELAVAETGSVLVFEDRFADRLVSMLSLTLVQLVERGAIVDSLDDAADVLAGRTGAGYAALVTGSSRTADIERSLTEGVQGPGIVHVIVIGDERE